jgi:hypothetical protein
MRRVERGEGDGEESMEDEEEASREDLEQK